MNGYCDGDASWHREQRSINQAQSEFALGKIVEIIRVSDYTIFRYIDDAGRTKYFPVDGDGIVTKTLDHAIMRCMVKRYNGNSDAYFKMMQLLPEMEW